MAADDVVLELADVHVAFAAPKGAVVPIIAGVSLQVRRGEFVSLIGPSGSGKSTLFRVIAGLLEPAAGRVTVAGAGPDRRGRVGYMPQNDCLMPWRTVLQNAVVFLELQGMPRRRALARARELLGVFGLAGAEQRYPHQLSGGMRQRAAFLRTVLGGQEVLLLDEPFGALDALTRAAMQAWLLTLWQRLGKTVLFVTHDVEEALLLSDRVYALQGSPVDACRELVVDLGRPRHPDLVTDPRLIAQRATLLGWLQSRVAAVGAS